MSREHQSVSETVAWLSFPRQAYPNFYLNAQRIEQRFRSYLGSIRDFSQSVERSNAATASVKALFLEAGIDHGRGGETQIAYDLADPLAQVLVLRAYLTTVGELQLGGGDGLCPRPGPRLLSSALCRGQQSSLATGRRIT